MLELGLVKFLVLGYELANWECILCFVGLNGVLERIQLLGILDNGVTVDYAESPMLEMVNGMGVVRMR